MLLSGTKQFQRQHGLRQQNKQALEQNTQQFTSNFGPSSIQLYKCRHNEEHCEMSRTVRWYRINGRRRAKEQNRTDYGKHTSEKNNDSRRNGQRETIVKLSKVARCTSVAVSLLLLLTFSVTHVECSRADSVAGRSFRTALLCTRSHITLVIGAPKQFNGIVYTEGHFHDANCKFSMQTTLTMHIPYNGCGTQENEHTYSNVVIVQKHPKMMTADDEVYHIICDKKRLQDEEMEFTLGTGYSVNSAGTVGKVFTDIKVLNKTKSITEIDF